jgi:hypothetical protein
MKETEEKNDAKKKTMTFMADIGFIQFYVGRLDR